MTVANFLEVGAAVIAALATVYGLYRSVRNEARQRAEQDRRERAELAGRAHAEGVASRQGEVDLLKSQRDDARKEREDARGESREWRERYMDLRDNRS